MNPKLNRPRMRAESEIIADDVSAVLARLPSTLTEDQLESRIVMELMIWYRPPETALPGEPDLLHPDVNHAIAQIEECFCRYREELVSGEAPDRARAFWVAAALRILRRAGGSRSLEALTRRPDEESVIALPPDRR
jgi:G:T-mismatch repair DNA endonuclease (very short patch repair protein)